MGWKIVSHSFGLLFRNLGQALLISIGPYLIGIAAIFGLLALFGLSFGTIDLALTSPEDAVATGGGMIATWFMLATIILLFVSSWVAVGWHRFVLLEEPAGLLPALSGRPVWPYIGRVVLLVLLLTIIAIPVTLVLGLLMSPLFILAAPLVDSGALSSGQSTAFIVVGGIWALVVTSILSWFWMRFGLSLPSLAIGRPMRFGESWNATKPMAGTIFVAVIILSLLNIGSTVLLEVVFSRGFLYEILSLIITWISLMLGVSILTTLYGIIVEKRSLA